MITEQDVDVVAATQHNHTADIARNAQPAAGADALTNGLPESTQKELARRYAELFSVYRQHRADMSRVTFWGVTDGDSWLNTRTRMNYPLLFDRAGNPMPAVYAVLKQAR